MKHTAGPVLLRLALLLPLQGLRVPRPARWPAPRRMQHCAKHPQRLATGTDHECDACCCMVVSTAPAAVLAGSALSTQASPQPALAQPHDLPATVQLALTRQPRTAGTVPPHGHEH